MNDKTKRILLVVVFGLLAVAVPVSAYFVSKYVFDIRERAASEIPSVCVELMDGTCTADDDCVKINMGDCCGCTKGGSESAINASAADAYVECLEEYCTDISCETVNLCTIQEAYCNSGRCALRYPDLTPEPTCYLDEYRSCEEDTDCVRMDKVDCCGCTSGGLEGAVNADYQDDVETCLEECSEDLVCSMTDVCTEEVAACVDGMCELVEEIPTLPTCDVDTMRACTQTSDCVKINKDCCSCSMGGGEIAVNSEYEDEYEECLNCPPIWECSSLYNCTNREPECTNGLCSLVDPACTPDCTDKECGDDGCGGSCGTCPAGQSCNSSGECVTACVPDCAGKDCGDDGCGGTCGTCGSGESCNSFSGRCLSQCTPSCTGKTCGSDGCGGSCGTCATGYVCNSSGACVVQADSGGGDDTSDGTSTVEGKLPGTAVSPAVTTFILGVFALLAGGGVIYYLRSNPKFVSKMEQFEKKVRGSLPK